jgi:hypothetical protein
MHGETPSMSSIANTGRLLCWAVRTTYRRPRLTVALAVLLAILGVTYTLLALTFKTSTRSFLPQNAGYVARYAEYARDFGELEDIVVVEEAGSFEGPATMRPGSLRSCAIRWWSSVASPIESIRGAVR